GRRLWAIAGAFLLLVATLPSLRVDHLALTDADATPYRLVQYEWFPGNIGTTVSGDDRTDTRQPRPYSSAWLVSGERHTAQVLAGEANVRLLLHRAARQQWELEVAAGPALVQFPTLFWPGWQARVDGEPLAVNATPGSGLMAVE